jgi:hypothetical protein
MPREPWSDDKFDGATFIGPLNKLVGGDEPAEWNAIGGPNYYHDRAYYERRPNDRALVDRIWFRMMIAKADELTDPVRRDLLRRKARTRYAIVRAIGWLWWSL